MSKLIAIDPGHGIDTPGKRSPANLGTPILREYAFNREVARDLLAELEHSRIAAMLTVTDDSDPSLAERARRAHAAGCKLFVSVHANAGGGSGIETFHMKGDEKAQRLARLVQTVLVRVTGLPNRGLKTKISVSGKPSNSGVLHQAQQLGMSACLCELGFMDSSDLQQLRQASYRMYCAEAICEGICLYLGVQHL